MSEDNTEAFTENAIIVNIVHPEWGTWRVIKSPTPTEDWYHIRGDSGNVVMHKCETHFWRLVEEVVEHYNKERVIQMSEDTSEPINAELQRIGKSPIDLTQYMDSDEDINDLTDALNRVRDVQHRLYGKWS